MDSFKVLTKLYSYQTDLFIGVQVSLSVMGQVGIAGKFTKC